VLGGQGSFADLLRGAYEAALFVLTQRMAFFLVLTVLMASTCCGVSAAPLPAFPEAEGFGMYTQGGRGGQVIAVTNLNDSGPGSLRAAIETKGPRIVIFRVSGIIDLKKDLKVREPYLTIAGQTAPGDGICIRNYGFGVNADQVIIRYLRFRPGDTMHKEIDPFDIGEARDVIIDHCSACWGIDETLSVNGAKNDAITVQWCLISESLNDSYHKKGKHGYGSLIVGASGGYTFHHNAYVHHNSRNPRPGGKEGSPGIIFDFRNNLIYNWGHRAGYNSQTALKMNYVSNYLRPGPSTQESSRKMAFLVGGKATRMFMEGSVIEGFPEANTDNWLAVKPSEEYLNQEELTTLVRVNTPFPAIPVKTDPAEEAYQRILEGVGATKPKRDLVDERLIGEIKQGTGKIINSQSEVGGWPEYRSAEPLADSDLDGMPDEWETLYGLDPKDVKDGSADKDSDGYTNVEEYLNGTSPSVSDH
jgi:pectate lyase